MVPIGIGTHSNSSNTRTTRWRHCRGLQVTILWNILILKKIKFHDGTKRGFADVLAKVAIPGSMAFNLLKDAYGKGKRFFIPTRGR